MFDGEDLETVSLGRWPSRDRREGGSRVRRDVARRAGGVVRRAYHAPADRAASACTARAPPDGSSPSAGLGASHPAGRARSGESPPPSRPRRAVTGTRRAHRSCRRRSGERILDRQQPEIHFSAIHRLRDIEKFAAGHRLGAPPQSCTHRLLAVRAELPLKGDLGHARVPSRRAPCDGVRWAIVRPAASANGAQRRVMRSAKAVEVERLIAVGAARTPGADAPRRSARRRRRRWRRTASGGDERGASAGVARVDDHRQMRLLLEHRNRGDVEGVARRGLEGADAALAQHRRRDCRSP